MSTQTERLNAAKKIASVAVTTAIDLLQRLESALETIDMLGELIARGGITDQERRDVAAIRESAVNALAAMRVEIRPLLDGFARDIESISKGGGV